MTYYSDEKYEIERDGRIFTMKLEVDYDLDASWIGKYDKDARTFVVDRKDGFLYGDWEDEPEEPYDEDFTSDGEYNQAYQQWGEAWSEWHGKGEREILADVPSNYERGEYQYFRPYAGGLDPTDPETDLDLGLIYRPTWCILFTQVCFQLPDYHGVIPGLLDKIPQGSRSPSEIQEPIHLLILNRGFPARCSKRTDRSRTQSELIDPALASGLGPDLLYRNSKKPCRQSLFT